MFRILFVLFVVVPFVDLLILFRLGQRFGFVETIVGVILVGIVGAAAAKREGLRVLGEWAKATSEGRVPEEGILSSALVLVGAALLIMPGVLTDVVGLTLLFSPTRRLIAGFVRKRIERGMRDGSIEIVTFDRSQSEGPLRPPRDVSDVVDVEGEDITDRSPKRLP